MYLSSLLWLNFTFVIEIRTRALFFVDHKQIDSSEANID